MTTSYLHEFHFVMDRGMKKELENLDMYKERESLSGVIVKILTLFGPVIKREHKWGEERNCRYMPVCDDPDEVREHIHVYFPGEVYREIKLLHADLNCFSIAQLVRGFLELFLGFVKKFGNNVFQKLKRLFRIWNEESKANQITTRRFIRQLKKILWLLPNQDRLISIYNKQFSPFWIFRL